MTIDEVRDFMIQWNIKFPVDKWWRKKHGIPFLSPEHRECSFMAQLMEFEEDRLFSQAMQEENKDPYIPNIGDWLKRDDSEEISDYDIDEFRAEAEELAKLEQMEEDNG